MPARDSVMGSMDTEIDGSLRLCREAYGTCERDSFEDEQPAPGCRRGRNGSTRCGVRVGRPPPGAAPSTGCSSVSATHTARSKMGKTAATTTGKLGRPRGHLPSGSQVVWGPRHGGERVGVGSRPVPYGVLRALAKAGSLGAGHGDVQVQRGGSWTASQRDARSARRHRHPA